MELNAWAKNHKELIQLCLMIIAFISVVVIAFFSYQANSILNNTFIETQKSNKDAYDASTTANSILNNTLIETQKANSNTLRPYLEVVLPKLYFYDSNDNVIDINAKGFLFIKYVTRAKIQATILNHGIIPGKIISKNLDINFNGLYFEPTGEFIYDKPLYYKLTNWPIQKVSEEYNISDNLHFPVVYPYASDQTQSLVLQHEFTPPIGTLNYIEFTYTIDYQAGTEGDKNFSTISRFFCGFDEIDPSRVFFCTKVGDILT